MDTSSHVGLAPRHRKFKLRWLLNYLEQLPGGCARAYIVHGWTGKKLSEALHRLTHQANLGGFSFRVRGDAVVITHEPQTATLIHEPGIRGIHEPSTGGGRP